MVATRSQKRKADDTEPQDPSPASTGRPINIVLVKGVRGGKRPKITRDDDEQLTVPAPPATVHRHSKLKKLVIRNKSSENQSMYPMVIPVVFRGVKAEEPEEKLFRFTFQCVLRSKSPHTKESVLPAQRPAPGAVQKKRIAPKLMKA